MQPIILSPSLIVAVTLTAFSATSAAFSAETSPASAIHFSEVTRKVVQLDGHQATFIRVRPPILPLPPTPRAAPEPTSKEIVAAEAYAEKPYVSLTLSATVYIGGKSPVTELRWRDETGKIEHRAYSNADFRYLLQLTMLETETTVYSWFPFLDVLDLTQWPSDQKSPLPPGLVFTTSEPEYLVDSVASTLAQEETTLAGLDYLHAYYSLNYADLKADYENRELLSAAAEKQLRKHPPETPDTTLYFWPIKSRVNSR